MSMAQGWSSSEVFVVIRGHAAPGVVGRVLAAVSVLAAVPVGPGERTRQGAVTAWRPLPLLLVGSKDPAPRDANLVRPLPSRHERMFGRGSRLRGAARVTTYLGVVSDVGQVLAALHTPRHTLAGVLPELPPKPGLYAIYGVEAAWVQLRLGEPRPEAALYVGKAEDSLLARDLDYHFGDGRTGSSTVRRSFAALLREQLMLSAIPRNPTKPGHFANYGLAPTDDAKLTAWMRRHLQIAVWPWNGTRSLADIERAILQQLNPPLNIAGVRHDHRAALQAARKIMADQARAWRPPSGSGLS
jgi:hypothetical protein